LLDKQYKKSEHLLRKTNIVRGTFRGRAKFDMAIHCNFGDDMWYSFKQQTNIF